MPGRGVAKSNLSAKLFFKSGGYVANITTYSGWFPYASWFKYMEPPANFYKCL